MLAAHEILAVFVVAVPARRPASAASFTGGAGGPGGWLAHALALAQTLLVAQVALGLLLLSDDRRAADELHYAYGSLSLGRNPRALDVRARGRAENGCSGSPAPRSSRRRWRCER